MNTLPVVQTFFGKPVRFFKAEFQVEMNHHNGGSFIENPTEMGSRNGTPSVKNITETHPRNGDASIGFFTLETWAISLPDYCRAIGYPVKKIFDLIQRSKEVFDGFYRQEIIPDTLGRRQKSILIAVEMCDMLTAKLHTSRIKDPKTRAAVIQFQRWVILMFGLIRRGRLRPVRWIQGKEAPPEYLAVLSLPSGRETRKAVLILAEKNNITEQQVYRRIQKLTGTNIITVKGKPRRTRSDKGSYRNSSEYQQVLEYRQTHTQAMGAEIKRALDLSVSAARINGWIRDMFIH